MKYPLIYILLLLSLLSCSTDKTSTDVNIRIKNVSLYGFENLEILDFSLENLAPNETTKYRPYEKAYRIATVFVEIKGEGYALQVNDFVGEVPLKEGRYTYEIGYDQGQENITFEVRKD